AAASEINVAFVVERHAIGAQFAEQPLVRQRTVRLDCISESLSRADVGDVEGLAVERANDAVGLFEVGGDTLEILAVSLEEINMLAILLHRRIAPPIGAFVKRIGKINGAVGPNPKVVWAVEELPAEILHQHGELFVGCDCPQLVFLVGVSDEVAVVVELSAVGASARYHSGVCMVVFGAPFTEWVDYTVGN